MISVFNQFHVVTIYRAKYFGKNCQHFFLLLPFVSFFIVVFGKINDFLTMLTF